MLFRINASRQDKQNISVLFIIFSFFVSSFFLSVSLYFGLSVFLSVSHYFFHSFFSSFIISVRVVNVEHSHNRTPNSASLENLKKFVTSLKDNEIVKMYLPTGKKQIRLFQNWKIYFCPIFFFSWDKQREEERVSHVATSIRWARMSFCLLSLFCLRKNHLEFQSNMW